MGRRVWPKDGHAPHAYLVLRAIVSLSIARSESWMDLEACRWPDEFDLHDVASHFLDMNDHVRQHANETIISFSHFLPRIDVMPTVILPWARCLYPVLGTHRLEHQIRRLGSAVHVYGHSHVNRRIHLDGTLYVNNALAYPHETRIASRELACVYTVA